MIVIPMAGLSSRFFKARFDVPKYQLKIGDDFVFDLALKSFERYFTTELFVIVLRDAFDAKAFAQSRLAALGIKNYLIKVLDFETQGQAETVLLGIDSPKIADDEPLFIFNIDTFRYDFSKPDFLPDCAGYLEVFQGDGDHWSFIKVDDKDNVIRTTEKERISNLCSDGLYYFANKKLYIDLLIKAKAQNLLVNNELYIAPIYNLLIEQGKSVRYHCITDDEIDFCGTPDEYNALLTNGLKRVQLKKAV
ncbi:glycosyltransferase family 2 protein [Psychrobacter ciconiae]|uniref:glycosyltransferase family 2 protein n=1 Tax=Psychrobacter ciconiae TaxID=1553449 RepID=UPI00191AFC87|nr:glycosyltransferase family 2 protein [Psychrobacter ciconiae]